MLTVISRIARPVTYFQPLISKPCSTQYISRNHLLHTMSPPVQLAPSASVSPPSRRGMVELDRSAFDVEVQIVSALVPAGNVIGQLRNNAALRNLLLDLPKTRTVAHCPAELSPSEGTQERKVLRFHASNEGQLPEAARKVIREAGITFVHETVKLGYENWSAGQILSSCLPETKEEIPSSFTTTGHVAHMNLREDWLPYRYLIGQVILDKNPTTLRTVVNKLDTIHAQFRYFDMEVIAGDKDYIATVNESSCTFTFDFSKVYWNSRLHSEHERLINLFTPGSLISDVMAGVGPFAVPAAKKGCYVLGNDLNPESVRWMRENRIKNKVEPTLRVSEVDGHEFIRLAPLEAWTEPFDPAPPPRSSNRQRDREAKEARRKREQAKATGGEPEVHTPVREPTLALEPVAQPPRLISHFVMNLPDSALTFLCNYVGCYTPLLSQPSFLNQYGGEEESKAKVDMPMVHCYCFTKEIERELAETDILKRASDNMSYDLKVEQLEDYNLHLVRSVAPNKDMYCLSFRLPREIAFGKRSA